MKPKKLAPLALALPLALLAACAAADPGLAFSARWFPSPSHPDQTKASETLEYTVSTAEIENKQPDALYAEYEGNYRATLEYTVYNSVPSYHFTGDFTAAVTYTGQDAITETVRSEVWFALENDKTAPMRPFYSVRTVDSVVPDVSAEGSPLTHYHYTFAVTYDWEADKAAVKFDNLLGDGTDSFRKDGAKDEEATVDLRGNGTYLDNEEILFALRGVSLEGGVSFRSINPVKDKTYRCVPVSTQTSTAVEYETNFMQNGNEVKEKIDAHRITIGYTEGNTGSPRTYVYADTVSGENTYRNVLLEMREPLIGGMGTLVYTLSAAKFIG